MTNDEWEGICTLLEAGWPGEFDDVQRLAYRTLLGDMPADQVVEAIRTLTRRGGSFRPSVSELASVAAEDPTKPTFTEALSAIRRVVPIRPNEAALDAAERIHPYLAAFIRVAGLDRLRQWPIDDPEYGPLERQRLRGEWDRFVERADERITAGLAIEAPRRQQLGPRRPDFAGALPEGPS